MGSGSVSSETAGMSELFQLLQSSLPVFTGVCAVLGLMVGSFSSDVTRERVSLHRNCQYV
jgi:hypothetical protein